MPAICDERVPKMLEDKNFYPKLDAKERKSKAWAICTAQEQKNSGAPPHFIYSTFIPQGNAFIDRKDPCLDGICPTRKDTLLVKYVAQTTEVKKDGFRVTKQFLNRRFNGLQGAKVYLDHQDIFYPNAPKIGGILYTNPNNGEIIIEYYPDNETAKLVINGVRNRTIPQVSTVYWMTELQCNICGQIGYPHLTCGHVPLKMYNGVQCVIDILDGYYENVSATANGKDYGAFMIAHNSCLTIQANSVQGITTMKPESLINEKVEEIKHPQFDIHSEILKMSAEEKKELTDKIKKLEAVKEDLTGKLSQLNAEKETVETLKEQIKKKDDLIANLTSQNDIFKQANADYKSTIESLQKDFKSDLISKCVEAQINAGWITEQQKAQVVKFLEDSKKEYIVMQTNNAMEAFKKMQGAAPPAPPQATPTSSDTASQAQMQGNAPTMNIAKFKQSMGNFSFLVDQHPNVAKKMTGGSA